MNQSEVAVSRASKHLVVHVLHLEGQIAALEERVSALFRRITALEETLTPNLHVMEVTELERVAQEVARQDSLTLDQLQSELRKEYGGTRWAKRMIGDMIQKRFQHSKIFS